MKKYGPNWLGLGKYFPYPLRATKFSLDLCIFSPWWKPEWYLFKNITEFEKVNGSTIWFFRWLFFQLRYSRWI